MNYASWLVRVGTNTVDGLVAFPLLVVVESSALPSAVDVVLAVLAFGLFGYNRWYLAGRTGRSWGRGMFGVRMVGDRTGRPIGMGRAALRDLAHTLDVASLYIGYLLPLIVAKRQTIADLVCRTVVVKDAPAAGPA